MGYSISELYSDCVKGSVEFDDGEAYYNLEDFEVELEKVCFHYPVIAMRFINRLLSVIVAGVSDHPNDEDYLGAVREMIIEHGLLDTILVCIVATKPESIIVSGELPIGTKLVLGGDNGKQ
jgi:hypothetical protein